MTLSNSIDHADASPAGPAAREARQRVNWLGVLALGVTVVLILPVAWVTVSVFTEDQGTLAHLADTVLPGFAANTLLLVIGVGIGVLIVGTPTAWLVTMCEFPGRRFFEGALILPLAFPAYVIAYAYTDLLSHPGFVQSTLRELTGWGPRDYWFPNIRSPGGAIAMFIFVLYPYVYLLGRAAFLEQSTCYADVSRTLGRTAFQSFRQVSLPLARPALAGGTALALMETLADFGTVAHFGVHTFTTGIYQAWLSMDDLVAAGQLSTMLLAVVLTLVVVERAERRRARFHHSRRMRDLTRYRLAGARAWLATLTCSVPVLFGFVLPVLILLNLSYVDGHDLFTERYAVLVGNSLTLGFLAALAAVLVALVLAYAARLAAGRLSRAAVRLANLGYAVPGSVIAVGILMPLATFDNAVDAFMQTTFGISTGLLLTGSLAALVFAYVVRFMAVALTTVEASLAKIPESMDDAARTLGSSQFNTLRRVHMPLLSGGLLTAALMVFIDVMKELPATLILRPFNYDTLAVQAYRLASDERLAQASTPSLVLVAAGLIPVIILSRRIMTTRVGRRTH
ncbi:MAG: iron ABC transporter permease [Pirellulales bacterium]|nr:iron ABC transporter permease [Pirellulales bacterium]